MINPYKNIAVIILCIIYKIISIFTDDLRYSCERGHCPFFLNKLLQMNIMSYYSFLFVVVINTCVKYIDEIDCLFLLRIITKYRAPRH